MATNSMPLPPTATANELPERRALTRRKLLLGAAAGGAALLTTNAVTALATHQITSNVVNAHAQEQLQATRAELEAEISRLQRQLALYDDMERIGLDRMIHTILEVYDRLWPTARSGIGLLRKGLGSIDGLLTGFEQGLAALRAAARLLGDLLTGLEAQVSGVRGALNEILNRTGPVAEAVSGFLSWLLSKIPFGAGARALEAADRLSALVANVPTLISDTRARLLEPLEQQWLTTADGKGLQGGLFDPLRRSLLTPLQTHLEQIEEMATVWEEEVAGALRVALAAREKIRQEITGLQQTQHSDGTPA